MSNEKIICPLIKKVFEVGQTEWNLRAFELISIGADGYIFEHPEQDVKIIIKNPSIGTHRMLTKRDLGVKIMFQRGKFKPFTER